MLRPMCGKALVLAAGATWPVLHPRQGRGKNAVCWYVLFLFFNLLQLRNGHLCSVCLYQRP